MTKEKYMALADFQTLWDNKLKPWINGQKADKTDVNALASAIGIDTDVEFVDLGLPSGTLWAKCNIGATVETDYGNYYMYGKGATQYNSSDSAYTGNENPLDTEHDTATQVMGAPWHMPTQEQIFELIENTTFSWQTNFNGSGINGAKFTAANGNYIFLPAGGYKNVGNTYDVGAQGEYWGSTPNIPTDSSWAHGLLFTKNGASDNINSRSTGVLVRGVTAKSVTTELSQKADKTELPTYATPAECRAIVTDYTPSE